MVVESVNGVPYAFVSWNGATEVAHWRLLTGRSARSLTAAKVVPRQGFETRIALPATPGYVGVDALDKKGHLLAASPPVAL